MLKNTYLLTTLLGLGMLITTLPLGAQSQATTGVIEVVVKDDQGNAVPGATVMATNTATNYQKTAITDASGRYRAVLMPLGPYRVTVNLDGFDEVVRDGLQLEVGRTMTLSIQMGLTSVSEEIDVSGDNPVIETANTANSVLISREEIESIPVNGRNFLELTKLTPGVSTVQGPDGEELTVNGQKGIQNNISVDGADFNNPFFGEQRGGQRPAFTFNLDAVQEFVVVADGAPAEFGRSSSGFVNVVTKSGTNDLKGSAHLFYSNDSLTSEAKRANGNSEPKFDEDRTQVGFTLGGPITTDQLFFFTAVDFQDGNQTKQNDPNRIEPRVVDAFAALGSANENAPIERTDDAFVWLGKIDRIFDNHLATVRATYTDSEQENGTFDVDSWGISANAVEKSSSWSIGGSLLSSISSETLNEFRLQYAFEDRPRPYGGAIATSTGRPFPDTAFDFGNSYRFGMPFFIPVVYDDTRWQVNNNLTLLKGDHNIKTGFEYNRTEAFQTFVGFANGRFIFSSTDGFLNYVENPNYVECADSNGNFVTGSGTGVCPDGLDVSGPVLLYLQQAGVGNLTAEEAGTQTITQEEPAVFIQDVWQPTANLTLSLGLRWEAQIQPDPITPANEVFYAPFIGQTVNGQEFPSDGEIPSDYDMWQPRLGLTWDPTKDGRTVVRANAGIYYARIPGLVLASSRSTNGSRGQSLFRNSALTPFLGAPPAYPDLIPQSEVGDPFRPDVFVFDKDFQNPRTTAAAVAVEREVAPKTVVLFKYNYAETDHLTRFVNRNDPLLGSPWQTGLEGGNGIGVLTVVESSARSEYQGFTLGITRDDEIFSFAAYYTNSRDKSDDDNERDPFSFRYARITDLDAEWGYSDRDQRHRGNLWALWRAPGGVDVNLRYTYQSAQPQSITASGAVAQTPQDRINDDGTVTRRNLGRKDNKFSSIDIRISKVFDIGSVKLEAVLDGFNLTNEPNPKSPEVTNLIFNFDGTVTSGLGDPRQFQLGVRLMF